MSRVSEIVAQETGFKVGYRNYLRFDLFMFIFKNFFYHKPLRLVESDLRALQTNYRVSVIAHSFGTWLLLKALTENRDLQLHNVILCGAVFPRATSFWRQLTNDSKQISGEVLNFCGARDPFPALAELLSRNFGASGVVGAGDPMVEDSYHDLTHSGFMEVDFCREYWLPLLLSSPRTRSPAHVEPRPYVKALLWMSAHRGVLLIAAVAAVAASYFVLRSEASCAVRRCYVDVVRIYNYANSGRVVGPLRYVNEITFSYAFNYDLKDFVFKAATDRRPEVISFVGEQLTNLDGQESSETVKTADGIEDRKYTAFHVPARDRRAYFSAEFANEYDVPPGGATVFAAREIRNLRIQILLPAGVSLVPVSGTFREGVLINGAPDRERAARCTFATDGRQINCSDLDLPANVEFFYCFAVKGWNSSGEISPAQVDKCKQGLH
ncbi:hypothetical protein NKH95_26675 [Mesorhizobium sp. M0848]|uniref:hypothetical protein n=1 Tax=Mesorhizobium sp. M0848 TaxID=2957012 RepID=UPI003338A3A9